MNLGRIKGQLPRDLTSWVSILCFGLAMVMTVFYYFSMYENLYYQVFIAGWIMLIPFVLHRLGYKSVATILLSLLAVILPMFLSVYNKELAIMENSPVNAVNYFDVRLLVICSILVPMTTIPLQNRSALLLGITPSFLGTILYDPIHEFYNVGYYDAGLTSPDYYFSVNLFSMVAWIFLAMAFLFMKMTIERNLHREMSRRERLERYMTDLMELGSSGPVVKGQIREGYKHIIDRVSESLNGLNVSVWEFEDNYKTMVCKANSSKFNIYQDGFKVTVNEDEQYFFDLFDKGIIISNQGDSGKDRKEYKYLHRGKSFLDIIFFRFGKPGGVLSCELNRRVNIWSAEDSLFLKAAGDLISLIHANQVQRKRNEDLERRVQERTAQLQKTNRELQEYAFLNSHILRAPIARVFGMYRVIEAEYSEMMTKEILEHFQLSIEELDKITKRIDFEIASLSDQ